MAETLWQVSFPVICFKALSLLSNNFKTTQEFPHIWAFIEYTEKLQVPLKITSSKKDQHFTKDLTLALHEDSESEIVLHGKSKVWLKYYTIILQIANKTKKENLKPWCFCGLNFARMKKRKKKRNQNTSAQNPIMDHWSKLVSY